MASLEHGLITGGDGGLAVAMAAELRDAGMEVSAAGRRELDVCDEEMVKGYFSKFEKLDLLVCNAGCIRDEVLLKMREREWDEVMEVNLKGAFLTARAAVRKMLRAGGHVVFVSSYSAFKPPVGQANYAAAKAGLVGFAKSLASELGGKNVRVNVIVPGFLETKMTDHFSEDARKEVREKHCLKRLNEVECVAKFLRCLHFDMPHTSGQIFHLDSRIL